MSTGTIKKVAGPLVIAEGMRDANMFDVVRVSSQRLIGEIFPLCPSYFVPECIADIVLCECDQGYFVDAFFFQCLHRKYYHGFSDASHSVIHIYTHMIQTAPSSIMPAENRSDDLPIFFGNYACCWISF